MSRMVEAIPAVLNELTCDFCEGFLSCPPVFETSLKKRSCGRCPKPEESAIRMELYEMIATVIAFPCRNVEIGCDKLILFHKQKLHDQRCEFKPYRCPISEECLWVGPRRNIVDHCEDNHSGSVLLNISTITSDVILKTSYKVYLILAVGNVYVLKAKICHKTRKVHFCLRLLGELDDVEMMTFKVKLIHKSMKITKMGIVAREKDLSFDENVSISVNFDTMIDVLGVFDNFSYKVTIARQCDKCRLLSTILNHYLKKGMLCRACEQKLLNSPDFRAEDYFVPSVKNVK